MIAQKRTGEFETQIQIQKFSIDGGYLKFMKLPVLCEKVEKVEKVDHGGALN